MKHSRTHSNWPFVFAGTALLGFLVGACVEHNASSNPANSFASDADAQSQTGLGEDAQPSTSRGGFDLAAMNESFASIARKVTPAVVNIQSTSIIPGQVVQDPFANFFGDNSNGGLFREPDQKSQSLGSGVIINANGLILTNNHVVKNATQILVTLTDRRRFPARLLGADADSDVAVLKIDATALPTLKLADSDKLEVGDIVMAVGSPFNLSSTVTHGIISAIGRHDLGINTYEDFLQTDAPINPGNSGGALVDIYGNLVGINTAILSESGGNQGIGLAIPVNLARRIGQQLAQTGHVTRGWLGVVVQPLTDDVATQLGLPDSNGLQVTGIYSHGPAGNLPWSQNGTDIILAVNGNPIDSAGSFRNLVANSPVGTVLTLHVWQDGKTNDYQVTLARKPDHVQGI